MTVPFGPWRTDSAVASQTRLNLAEILDTLAARPLPAFPAVLRDLSLVVPRSLPWSDLAEAATKAGGPLLELVEFLDTFDLPDAMHSLHFGLTFRHPDRTLTGEEADAAVRAVLDACKARFDAALRS